MEVVVKHAELTEEVLRRAARVLKLLAHPCRLMIIEILEKRPEGLPVHAITQHLGLQQAAVSRHLGLLQSRGLIGDQRRGREVWYRIIDGRCLTILDCIRKSEGNPT